ncbi:MAG: DUF4435 domain-containing protein [Microcoleus sp. PH2017_10_PVI_O_A]|uniref:DUF4435 domain-containing protein n=1 Tax=unclassified Microcoleus TaxID=2642155 RepID=UPI001DB56B30|nr:MULTISPECIES: DUF4435 domain-containing protein [unclassified Microcoleus]TAE81215.1 MAG: DUF4435 domain-containing protein [Oscillatoriales cyanobacterium]MCC3407212.1 DUF4435 domain-containing protein [Microcoleus sp. PH2017_10_PVI_O_A]MCC3461302.1 DUF4435 domain-containing protein [Microcoleus sp. PH2017_11_PCY_U_A]MCC3479758.1 DUF4435 domain-containing protein [Microcoleus sp. PH2017_12_PCY_D_A]MCC3531732.1 DUF4435 domain-containing protein [Microcoleus sp. PH2017_21_RUC_O_A]
MTNNLKPDRIANKLRLLRTQSKYTGSFVIAEGDTDARVWKNLIDSTKCRVEIAHNKDNVVKVLNILEKDNFAGVLAIVDADFWILEGTVTSSSNLLLTDTHDLETMLLKSPALEKVLSEHGSEQKINNFGKDIRQTLLESAKVIGYLRWVSLKFNYALKFEGLAFSKFVDDKTLELNESKLLQTVKNNSQKLGLDEAEIIAKMDSLKTNAQDMWYVCCGHDMICILSIALCKALGTCNSKQVEPDVLEKDLRLAYESSHFQLTQLYTAIQDWEKTNQPFQVLSSL